MVKTTGKPAKTGRLETGWWSFDRSFVGRTGRIGLPLYLIVEIHGPKGSGKTTLASSLASKIRQNGTVEYCDLETQDSNYISTIMENQGFTGTIDWVSEDRDEDVLDKLAALMGNEETSAGILDSIGAISPIAERESSLADANMGRRAKLMAAFTRKVTNQLRNRESPASLFMLNHQLAAIGWSGTITPGGTVKDFMDGVKLKIKMDEKFDDGSYTLKLMVEKNRMGKSLLESHLFMLSGMGVHTGMTAVIDCINLKLAEVKRTISLDGKSFGYIKTMINYADTGDPEPFLPFIKALEGK